MSQKEPFLGKTFSSQRIFNSKNFEIEAFPKLQFWKSNLRFIGKTGLLDGFPKPVPKPCFGFGTGSITILKL